MVGAHRREEGRALAIFTLFVNGAGQAVQKGMYMPKAKAESEPSA
jgi:hypothetical protein